MIRITGWFYASAEASHEVDEMAEHVHGGCGEPYDKARFMQEEVLSAAARDDQKENAGRDTTNVEATTIGAVSRINGPGGPLDR